MEWISINEKLPPCGEWVLVVIEGVVQHQAANLGSYDPDESCWEWADEDGDPAPLYEVTHWMPLPDPPEVK